jgi:hypothetical protein
MKRVIKLAQFVSSDSSGQHRKFYVSIRNHRLQSVFGVARSKFILDVLVHFSGVRRSPDLNRRGFGENSSVLSWLALQRRRRSAAFQAESMILFRVGVNSGERICIRVLWICSWASGGQKRSLAAMCSIGGHFGLAARRTFSILTP